jgi:hypothetical protein
MPYKTKIKILSGLVIFLVLVYIFTLLLDSGHFVSRGAAYIWLDPEWLEQIDRLEITGSAGEDSVILLRRNENWSVFLGDGEYPARQTRIGDLLRVLSGRFNYPVRGISPAAYERLALTEETASRIVARGGAGVYPLLDLLIGRGDSTGSEVYLRRNNRNEVRSGEDRLSPYLTGSRTAWYDLRLFPDENLGPESVQRLTVAAPLPRDPPGEAAPEGGSAPAPLVFTRNRDAGGWTLGSDTVPDKQRVESYIRAILDAEGENFILLANQADLFLNAGRIVLELGDGSIRTIRVGYGADDPTRLCASVSGSPYVYALADWTADRIFRDAAYFGTR